MLNRQEFFDRIYMRYMWKMKNLPSICDCDAKFTLEHALCCHLGTYMIQRYNNLRDLGENLMREISHDVRVEPFLLEIPSHEITDLLKSAIKDDETRAEFSANGFW